MRLAILSDIHGNLAALETVLADLRSCAPDAIVNLGDCVTSPLWPRETLELLETLRRPTVRGNHDRWVAEMPPERVTRTVTFTHDALTAAQRAALGAELARRLGSVTAGLVLCSHSHFPCVALAPGDRLVVNPGSIGCPRYADNADPFASEINSPHASYALATCRNGRWSIELIALDYDWSVVAQRARANGRPDWAAGFLGF